MNRKELTELILVESREWLGTPYQHQASVKQVGCDCLGFLRGIWRHVYGQEPQALPAYSSDWGEANKSETLLNAAKKHLVATDSLEPGIILMFRWKPHLPAKHLGIISGNSTFIHAYERAGVIESRLGSHWRSKVAAQFEFPSLNQGGGPQWRR